MVITKKEKPLRLQGFYHPAEEEGFEPPDLLQSTVFKTAAIDHSAIPPISAINVLTLSPSHLLRRSVNLFAVANIETFSGFQKHF